jgi:hypothetical protein
MTQAGEPPGQRDVSEADEAHDAKRRGCLRLVLGWLPHWATALLLLIPVMLYAYVESLLMLPAPPAERYVRTLALMVVLFLPGAIKRLNWRHALVMLGLGAAWAGVDLAWAELRWPWSTLFPWLSLLNIALTIFAVGLGESLLRRDASLRTLAWLAVASLSAGAVYCLIARPLRWVDLYIWLPTGPSSGVSWPLSAVLNHPLLTLLCWVTVPVALRAAQSARCAAWRGAALTACPLVAFMLFFGVLAYPLVERSFMDGVPFAQHFAAWLLGIRGRHADCEMMWNSLENANWQRPLYSGTQGAWLRRGTHYDWRAVCVSILAQDDAAGTAQRLSEMLAADPTPALTEVSAEVLAQNHRYETVPILMRYALLGRGYYSDVCQRALEDMRLPRAAMPILVQAQRYGRSCASHVQGEDLHLGAEHRKRLIAVLGWDAGASLSAWTKSYDERIRDTPSPLPESIRAETDQVIACFTDFSSTVLRWYRARGALSRRMLADDGKTSETQALDEWYRQHSGKVDPFELIDPEVERQAETIQHYLRRATEEMRVALPYWHVPTTQEFSKEIDAYIKRVNAVIAKHFPSQGTSEVPQSEK